MARLGATTVTTARFTDAEYRKPNARTFTVQVGNQTVLYQVNLGHSDEWMPSGGIELRPGYWNFDSRDWQGYGTDMVQGIRFAALSPADPGTVTAA